MAWANKKMVVLIPGQQYHANCEQCLIYIDCDEESSTVYSLYSVFCSL